MDKRTKIVVVILVVAVGLIVLYLAPPKASAPPCSGCLSSVRAKDWNCSSSSGNVQAMLVNAVGEKITVMAPNGGCKYTNGTKTDSIFNVSANGVFTCTYNALAGCVGVPEGGRFESTITVNWWPAADYPRKPRVDHNQIWRYAIA